jgi:DNA-dependent RNA polymerase auxiliary subunit epsilon
MISCCPRASDDFKEDVRGHGGGKINRKFILLVLMLVSLALTSNASAAADNLTDDLNGNSTQNLIQTQNTTENLQNTTDQESIQSSDNFSSENSTTNSSSDLNSNKTGSPSGSSNVEGAAGDPSEEVSSGKVSFTIQEIINAANDVKRFLEGNKYLPEYININGTLVNQATFLQLLAATTIKINNSDSTLIDLINVQLPGSGSETVTPGTFTKTEYLALAQTIQTYISNNQKAPATISTSFGNIGFDSLIYLYSRGLSLYESTNVLPTFLAVRPWGTFPITDTTKNSITTQDVVNTAVDVRNFVNYNKYFPEFITVNGIVVNQATFLELLTEALLKIGNGDTTALTLLNVIKPVSGAETVTPGTFAKTEYLVLAQDIQTYFTTNQKAPASMSTVFGDMKFESLLYLYSRALSMYASNGVLATFMAVRPWSSIPITDTSKTSITTQDVVNTAVDVRNFVNYNKYFPEFITVNGIVVNQATFLELLTEALLKIGNGDTSALTLVNVKQPGSGTETVTPGTFNKTEYLALAQTIQTYIVGNGQAPATISTSLGNVKFESLLYLYSRVLSNYKEDSNKLPALVTIRSWSTTNLPIMDEFFTVEQITKAANDVKRFVEGNKYLPEYITVNGVMVNQSQFLYLIATATLHINSGDTSLISLISASVPGTSSETVTGGSLLSSEYLTLANTIKNYIESNQKAPSSVSTSLGTMSYQSLLYMYCRILNLNSVNQDLPIVINVKPWKTANIPITDKTSFTVAEITSAAVDVKNFVDGNGYMPEWITVGGVALNQTQFLHLLAAATILINSSSSGSVNPVTAVLPSTTVNDALTSGNLSTDSYVQLAQYIKSYIEQNKEGPSSMTVSLGTVSFKSLIYMYSRVLQQYNLHKTLPATIILKGWTTQNIPIYDDYFTNQEISKVAAEVRAFVDGNGYMPEYITISGVVINRAQFLYLLTTATVKINNNDNSVTYLQKASVSANSDQTSSGSMGLTELVQVAQSIKTYLETNQISPTYASTSLGQMGFYNLIYTYSRLLDYYNSNQQLPSSVTGIKSWSLVVYKLPAGFEQYLAATANCQADNAAIIALANSITAGASTPYQKAVLIFNWVRDNIGYEFYYNTVKGAVGTLNSGGGNCVDTAHLLIALERAAGIPARYVHGYCQFSSGSWYGHVWAILYVDGQWLVADATSSRNQLGVINNWNTATYTFKGYYTSLPF